MNWFPNCIPHRITYLSRRKIAGIGRHTGVLIEWFGGAFVVDRQADKGLRVVSYQEFAQGHEVLAKAAIEEPGAVARAFQVVNESLRNAPGYDFFKRNCEHFARKVVFGEERSLQIEGLFAVAGLLLLVALASRA